MSKLFALVAAGALAATGAVAHPAHPGGVVEKRVCMVKKPGDAAAREVPCEGRPHDMAGGSGGHRPAGHHGMMIKMHGGPASLDANKDGRVSLDELTAPLREHFAEMDKDRSGFLEKGEMPDHGKVMFDRRIEKSE